MRLLRAILIFLLSPALILLAAVERNGYILERYWGWFFDVASSVRDLWRGIVFVCHLVGLVITVILLFASVSTFLYIVFKEFGYEIVWMSKYYSSIRNIVEDKVSWAAATTIVATTIAIGHVWNLELNQKKYMDEQKDRWKKEYDEKRKKEQERMNKDFIGK